MSKTPTIIPLNQIAESHRTGTIHGLTANRIAKILGFSSTPTDPHPGKVDHEWTFSVDGQPCNVWSYKGSHKAREFSTFGPSSALTAVFGGAYTPSL